ncbi:hypothetical protein [Streptomyces sp. NPDC048659]|uniref:hypothetical protein n=1 Tax=Streptomyces sp. NPDC048659 TaxID=3155489 RepID=UPI003424FE84
MTRRRRTPSTCRTGKFRHRDAIAAKLALARIDTGIGRRRERRAYRCSRCGGWHLTSQS